MVWVRKPVAVSARLLEVSPPAVVSGLFSQGGSWITCLRPRLISDCSERCWFASGQGVAVRLGPRKQSGCPQLRPYGGGNPKVEWLLGVRSGRWEGGRQRVGSVAAGWRLGSWLVWLRFATFGRSWGCFARKISLSRGIFKPVGVWVAKHSRASPYVGGTVPGGSASPAAVSPLQSWGISAVVCRGVKVGMHLVSHFWALCFLQLASLRAQQVNCPAQALGMIRSPWCLLLCCWVVVDLHTRSRDVLRDTRS